MPLQKPLITLSAVGTLLLLSGCASMSQEECLAADWNYRGETDGRAGRASGYVYEHTEACAEYGVKPDLEAYRAGWDRGIRQYCTRNNGWEVGLSGTQYGNSCPSDLQDSFYTAYRLGRDVQRTQSSVDSLQRQIDQVERDLEDDDLEQDERRELNEKRRQLRERLIDAHVAANTALMTARNEGFAVY